MHNISVHRVSEVQASGTERIFTHGSDGEQVIVQLSSLCGKLQRPLQVSAPQPQVHNRVVVTRLHMSLF